MDGCQPDITRSANTSSAVFLLKPKTVKRVKEAIWLKIFAEVLEGKALLWSCVRALVHVWWCGIVWCGVVWCMCGVL
jgi:hypothetical protein